MSELAGQGKLPGHTTTHLQFRDKPIGRGRLWRKGRGQVTIPKETRTFLDVNPSDKINFSIENGRVVLKSIKTLKNLRGNVKAKGKGDLRTERRQAKIIMGIKVAEEME